MPGLAILSVWIGAEGKVCDISPKKWYVTVYDCEDKPLVWNGKKYALIPAPSGHVSFLIPPGCYRVSAVWSYYQVGDVFYGNHFTDSALVVIACDTKKCVKLYNPLVHRCGIVFTRAVQDLMAQLDARIQQTPPPADLAQLTAVKDALMPVMTAATTIQAAMLAVAQLNGNEANAQLLAGEVANDPANVAARENTTTDVVEAIDNNNETFCC